VHAGSGTSVELGELRGKGNREGGVNVRTLQKTKSAAPEKLRGKVNTTSTAKAESTSAPFGKRRVRHPKNVEAKATATAKAESKEPGGA
jgi:hypothetical protein